MFIIYLFIYLFIYFNLLLAFLHSAIFKCPVIPKCCSKIGIGRSMFRVKGRRIVSPGGRKGAPFLSRCSQAFAAAASE